MNILDDLEEYSKLVNTVVLGSKSNDSDSKLTELRDKIEKHSENLNTLKDAHEMHKNDADSKISQLCIDLELQKRDHTSLVGSSEGVKTNAEALSKEVNDLKEYKQNMEDYKKVTNERIEKLVKLFLSINK
jgi:phage shock protein A